MSPFEKYLNEHISGSGAALHLLQVLARKIPADRAIYEGLHRDILSNRQVLEKVMAEAGFSRSHSMEMAARATALFVSWRFNAHGLERGGLGLVEALEALELGVHGQTLLWRSLMEMPASSTAKVADYKGLRERAEQQKAQVEQLRLDAVRKAFFSGSSNLK